MVPVGWEKEEEAVYLGWVWPVHPILPQGPGDGDSKANMALAE